MDIADMLTATQVWNNAICVNRPDEFCPSEDIMIDSEWTKGIAPKCATECLECPCFEQCERFLLFQLQDEDLSPTGIMAGVILAQKSPSQITKALAKVKKNRSEILDKKDA